jgi:MinD superfamily P-loop ATPase
VHITPCKPCCKQTAIEAFQRHTFYLLGCESCGTCFSITDDFYLFMEQITTFHKIHSTHPYTFDLVLDNGNVIFILP